MRHTTGTARAASLAAVLAALLASAGCGLLHHSHTPLPEPGPQVTITVPANIIGGASSTWSVSWIGGTAPYTIELDLGGGAAENVPAGTPAQSPFTHVFTMINPNLVNSAAYTYLAAVTDRDGLRGTAIGTYTIGGESFNAINIESAVFDDGLGVLTIEISARNDWPLTVSLATVPEIVPEALAKAAQYLGPDDSLYYPLHFRAEFRLQPAGGLMFSGASGTVGITVEDDSGMSATSSVEVSILPFALAADTLYAIASPTLVGVAEPVTVIVASGVPAHPLQYINGIGLTVESDAQRAVGTYNIGEVGGAVGDADGFWTAMAPAGGFLVPPDSFIIATGLSGGRERWDFNVTPIGGSDQTAASGALLNIQFMFGAPGVKSFSFEEAGSVKRTYYSDAANTQYFWGDITNDTAPKVTVTAQ